MSVNVCSELTGEMVAVNPALVAPAGTVTVAGTVTAALLLDRLTLRPPLGAAAFSVTVQASVPDPVMDALLQESALNAASGVAAVPVPLRLITAVPLVEELLMTVIAPVSVPAAAGLNCTFKL
jgi:NhaP-type Na+/H+ or K+/H+ antiporter